MLVSWDRSIYPFNQSVIRKNLPPISVQGMQIRVAHSAVFDVQADVVGPRSGAPDLDLGELCRRIESCESLSSFSVLDGSHDESFTCKEKSLLKCFGIVDEWMWCGCVTILLLSSFSLLGSSSACFPCVVVGEARRNK